MMLNENGYMVDMRSLAGPSGVEQHQAPVTYSHTHHHNMGMYSHDQQTHLRTHMEQPQTIMMQPQQQHHQISYIHHPLMNIAHQVPPKQDSISDPSFSVKILVKDNNVPKTKNKVGTAKIVKRKPPPPPVVVQPPPAPPPTDDKTQKKKGRKRKYAQSRQERKENMYKNLPYINSRNQEVKPKEFEDYDCKCPLKCRKRVSVEARRLEFEAFYALGSYTAQNVFLLERIKEINKKSKMPKVGKKKTKKKSQKIKREKNFPKMSSKYKKSQIISDEDSDSDCKEGILLDIEDTERELQEVESSEKVRDCTEDKKCFHDCTNDDDCTHPIIPIKHVYQYEKPLIIESTSFQYSHPENNIIFTDDKNSYFHYKNVNLHETHTEFLPNQDQQVPNIASNMCATLQTKDNTELQGTISVLQVSCPNMETPDSIHVTNSDDTISNIQIVDACQESDQMHSQIACVSIQPSQHIIYTSEHIPYNNHEIIYHTQHLQPDDSCQNQQLLGTNEQIAHETIFLSQDSSIIRHLTIKTEQVNVSKKKRKPIKTERKFTRIYRLKKIRVCREMFVKTLKISSGRVNTVLKKNRSGDGLYRKSGNQGGHNKLTEEQKMGVYNHISSMLQYMAQNPQSPPFFETKLQQKSPFPSGFSLKSIYKVYKSSREIVKPVSFTSYSRIFYKEFNPKKQTNNQQSNPIVDNNEKIIVLQPINEYNTQTQQGNTVNISTRSYVDNNSRIISDEPIYANSLPIHVYTQEIVETNSSQSDEPRKKGRKRKYGDLTRQERKYNMYRNLPYVNSRKQQVLPKQFEDYDCQCPLKCRQRVSPKERKREFDGYYNLGSYVAQNMYLLERVEECKKKRCYIKNRPAKRERNFSRVYKLSKVRVCREMFLKTLKISSVRVNTVLNKKRCGEESTYKRGLKQGGMNKITLEQKSAIVEHINCIIASLSSNQQPNSDGDFVFPQEYTFKRMYEIYLENNHSGKNVSFSTYRRVFNEKFDFRIKNF